MDLTGVLVEVQQVVLVLVVELVEMDLVIRSLEL
jgi:hypothetical protein